MAEGPLEPHPVLTDFYAERGERVPFVRSLFNRTASHYDAVNRLFSLGSGTWYRRRCLVRAGLRPGQMVVDVAIGTGLLAREALAITGDPSRLIGIDLSEGMLAVAREKLGISLVQAMAESLPLGDGVTDFVTMGYALRHVSDLAATCREFHRVLRRGGTLLFLEIGKPTKPFNRALAATYIGRIVPLLSRWSTGHVDVEALMRYHWETIETCVPADIILDALHASGFKNVTCKVDLDLFRCFTARKA